MAKISSTLAGDIYKFLLSHTMGEAEHRFQRAPSTIRAACKRWAFANRANWPLGEFKKMRRTVAKHHARSRFRRAYGLRVAGHTFEEIIVFMGFNGVMSPAELQKIVGDYAKRKGYPWPLHSGEAKDQAIQMGLASKRKLQRGITLTRARIVGD